MARRNGHLEKTHLLPRETNPSLVPRVNEERGRVQSRLWKLQPRRRLAAFLVTVVVRRFRLFGWITGLLVRRRYRFLCVCWEAVEIRCCAKNGSWLSNKPDSMRQRGVLSGCVGIQITECWTWRLVTLGGGRLVKSRSARNDASARKQSKGEGNERERDR